jgi:hypothetical protein
MFLDALKGQIQTRSERNSGRSRAILSTPTCSINPAIARLQASLLRAVVFCGAGLAVQAEEWINRVYIVPAWTLTLPVLVVCHRPKILDSIASRIGRIAIVVFCMYPSVTLLTA